MTKPSKLEWPDVANRWFTHGVTAVTVRDRMPEPRMQPARWVEIANRAGANGFYVFDNPVNDTGFHIADGHVTRTPEIFAAFALHAHLTNEGDSGDDRDIELEAVVRNAVERLDVRSGHYWHSNAKRVLPMNHPDRKRVVQHDWAARVDAAALRWIDLATHWEVLRYPRLDGLPHDA